MDDAEIREAFAVAYRFRQRYQEPVRETDQWSVLAEDIGRTVNEHAGNHLLRSLLIACYGDIERCSA